MRQRTKVWSWITEANQVALEEQRERARKAKPSFTQAASRTEVAKAIEQFPVTQFVGYDKQHAQGTLLAMLKNEQLVTEAEQGEDVELLLDVDPLSILKGVGKLVIMVC